MEINIPHGTRIVILEGIPGAGKNTLHGMLKETLVGKRIYDYSEEELLFGWKHGWIPQIDAMRLAFYEHFLTYCEQILGQYPDAVFVLNRFHISYRLYTALLDEQSLSRYEAILARLKKASSLVCVPTVKTEMIGVRAAHVERVDPVWQEHLKKRLAQRGFANLTDMYSDEQKKILALVEAQGLPYQTVHIEHTPTT